MVVNYQVVVFIISKGISEAIQLRMMWVLVYIAVYRWEVLVHRIVNYIAWGSHPMVLLAAAFLLLLIEFTGNWLLLSFVEHHFCFMATWRRGFLHINSTVLFCLLKFYHAVVLVYRRNTLIVKIWRNNIPWYTSLETWGLQFWFGDWGLYVIRQVIIIIVLTC